MKLKTQKIFRELSNEDKKVIYDAIIRMKLEINDSISIDSFEAINHLDYICNHFNDKLDEIKELVI